VEFSPLLEKILKEFGLKEKEKKCTIFITKYLLKKTYF